MIAVNEIFESIQGEGDYAGTPMIFIRVAGCNLACTWCDQPDTIHEGYKDRQGVLWKLQFTKMTEDNIITELLKYRAARVCLTGGEPTAHKLSHLIAKLQEYGKKVHMESNGTLDPGWVQRVDHVCVSPKREMPVHSMMIRLAHEMKFIVDEKFTIEEVNQYENRFFGNIYLQPCNFKDTWHPDSLKKTLDLVKSNPRFRLSLQLHKILGVR